MFIIEIGCEKSEANPTGWGWTRLLGTTEHKLARQARAELVTYAMKLRPNWYRVRRRDSDRAVYVIDPDSVRAWIAEKTPGAKAGL